MVVICSGAKSLLDLEATRERLETLGVPVLGYGTDQFPAFYSRDGGLPVDARVDSPEEVAAIVKARDGFGLHAALLVVVPVPVDDELPRDQAEKAIAQAVRSADERGIQGAKLTPFLLASIAELTEGRSVRANHSLLVNNARVAARIALAMAA
jgi:pseudouridine-5'-phosphate glycosidase